MALTQIKASNITDGTIVAAEIADDGITTAKIADDAVTAAKIDDAVELGGPSLGTSSVIRTNANTISENITFASNTNGMSAGTITIASGSTVTIASGTTWIIV
tara:strand:- start:540 stop:848 length:309 start_codon:yes stop_codon:yes gene_type:complete